MDPKNIEDLLENIYLIITRPNVPYVVVVVSRFMQTPHFDHWNVVIHILK